MKKILLIIVAVMLVTTSCHKDSVNPKYIKITYYGNGGTTNSGESSVQQLKLGHYTNIQANTFKLTDKRFTHWNTFQNGMGQNFNPEDYYSTYNYDYYGYQNPNELVLYAQWTDDRIINMFTGTIDLVSGKVYHFYDSGGPDSYYSNNEYYTLKLNAPPGKRIIIHFDSFYTCETGDYLSIGSEYYSNNNSPGTIYSTGSSITILFRSNYRYVGEGWEARIAVVD
ncbi:MAG: CUB domain-containing protein [Bacteroidales bacterium]|nr:CUB domain-containing protein [Bacteroidales bacterium]